MMNRHDLLLRRMEEIGRSIAESGHGLALLGLGSAGRDRERLDDYSDLDFFVIVEPGHKQRYLDRLDWLSNLAPLAYQFRNTVDGYKVLFADGVFCEFAVFEASELPRIPFAPGRFVWKRDGVDDALATPADSHPPEERSAEWLLGEALTNLYVGMCRFRRGERLSAARFVQHFAVDRLLELHEQAARPMPAGRDPFAPERRFEQRHPGLAEELPRFMPGYDQTPAAALAILDHLARAYPVNPAMASAIRQLCANDEQT